MPTDTINYFRALKALYDQSIPHAHMDRLRYILEDPAPFNKFYGGGPVIREIF